MTSSSTEIQDDTLRLIEAGFPCHQVGAETQRERDTGKSPPPNRLHIWWARRPLTPSRAAILGATLPADTDTNEFLKALGISRLVAIVDGIRWVLSPNDNSLLTRLNHDRSSLAVDNLVLTRIKAENVQRIEARNIIADVRQKHPNVANDSVLMKWESEVSGDLNENVVLGQMLRVESEAADPDFGRSRIQLEKQLGIRTPFDKYLYDRAYTQSLIANEPTGMTILDPTAGGGSIPFEALRLGHNVISNELNPVATVIQYATLDYPRRYGISLADDIRSWGEKLLTQMQREILHLFPASQIPQSEEKLLREHLEKHPEVVSNYLEETLDAFIYCREVTCPHCGGQAPLLNSYWLSKEDNDHWAVRLMVRSKSQVDIEPYKISGAINRQLTVELDAGTIDAGRGTCVHCKQVIDGNEIKAQGRGESTHGKMLDRLYCVVAVRFEPKLKRNGELDRYTTGDRAGVIKTTKRRFFRAPNQCDFNAVVLAEKTLHNKWDHFERLDLIPTESIPPGHKTGDEGGAGSGTDKPLKLGTEKWYQMFTPRQLLGHLILMEGLHNLKPMILEDLGSARGKAVVTYLQFAIDKGVDYNNRGSTWEQSRGIVKHIFARHDFSFSWTFGEMVFPGAKSGAAWGLSQIVDAYTGMAELVHGTSKEPSLTIINGSASDMSQVADASVDLVVNDPPYYNNVMYAELADFFYVWQKRSLRDLYPGLFDAYLTDKHSEAVANPFRDGSASNAKEKYEWLMREMYTECRRVTKPEGRMVLMFTHKSQDGWETLTQALIGSGWSITSTYPVESESGHSIHIKETASASSSIFIVCRKREDSSSEPALWKAFGGRGVQQRIIEEVQQGLVEFEALDLRPVDTMVASYGRALRVLSEKWPVLDGDETVSPIRALNEASRVVAQHQIHKLTEGRLKVEDLTPEAAMAVTLYGIAGLQPIRFDEVLNVARSLGIAIESTTAGYDASGRTIGYATEATGRRQTGRDDDIVGYHAPLVRKGSNLRLAKPEERNERRLASPQHEWDVLQGMLLKYREGDIPVARAYLAEHAEREQSKIIDLLRVWTKEMDDESLRQEGETILFGLQGA
jgi:putative DNA methylase